MDQEMTITKKKIKFKLQNDDEEHEFTQMDINSFDIQNPNTFASVINSSVVDNSIPNERILIIDSRYDIIYRLFNIFF